MAFPLIPLAVLAFTSLVGATACSKIFDKDKESPPPNWLTAKDAEKYYGDSSWFESGKKHDSLAKILGKHSYAASPLFWGLTDGVLDKKEKLEIKEETKKQLKDYNEPFPLASEEFLEALSGPYGIRPGVEKIKVLLTRIGNRDKFTPGERRDFLNTIERRFSRMKDHIAHYIKWDLISEERKRTFKDFDGLIDKTLPLLKILFENPNEHPLIINESKYAYEKILGYRFHDPEKEKEIKPIPM